MNINKDISMKDDSYNENERLEKFTKRKPHLYFHPPMLEEIKEEDEEYLDTSSMV